MQLIECSTCGTAVGVADYNNPSAVVAQVEQRLTQHIAQLERKVDTLEVLLRRK